MRQLIFRRNYYKGLQAMAPADRLEAYDAIMTYAFNNETVPVSPSIAPTLAVIFDSIDTDFSRFEERGWR